MDLVDSRTFASLRERLPSPAAVRVLRERELIAETPGGWFVSVRSPSMAPEDALRFHAWLQVLGTIRRYYPAVIDRMSAVRLHRGDRSIAPITYIRHFSRRASKCRHRLWMFEGHCIVLRPGDNWNGIYGTMAELAQVKTTMPFTLPVMGVAPLLLSLTGRDVEENLDTVVMWLRGLVVEYDQLSNAFRDRPRTVLMKRMGDLAHDAGNLHLANQVDNVLRERRRNRVSRTHTGVGRRFVVTEREVQVR